MKIALSELDWGSFGMWLGIIGGILALFLAALIILAYRHKK
jgi:cell division protein FtsX